MNYLKLIVFLFSLFSFFCEAQELKSHSFLESRKISKEDLKKKKEGRFFTGFPEISSDPLAGFGFGLSGSLFVNGNKENKLFAYSPYLMSLKADVTYFISHARELSFSFDMPYIKGSRWRLRGDFKMGQDPTNLYFGMGEITLDVLKFDGITYYRFKDYSKAQEKIRVENERQLNNSLFNTFKSSEFLLNLKADYALGNGKWKIMGGYEIQRAKFETFEGIFLEVKDKQAKKNKVLSKKSLLRNDFDSGKIKGLEGGWISILQSALIYDTRDFEPDPTSGAYFEIANEISDQIVGSHFSFDKFFIQAKYFKKIPVGPRTVFAGRIGIGNIFGKNAPFFEFQDQWSPDGSINALGGKDSLRGYRPNRFLARAMCFANFELRARLVEFDFLKQGISIGLAPFFDVGTIRDNWQDLGFSKLKTSYGGGIRIGWNQSTILFIDYGRSKEDGLLYFGVGQIF